MQRFLLCLMAMGFVHFFTTTGIAQCDTLLYEDFQGQTISASWLNLDVDLNTDANNRPASWHIYLDPETSTPTDTNYVVAASSWFSPAGLAQNWLILDSVTICSPDVSMAWKSAPLEGPQYMDGYRIVVSTTTSALSAFTDTIFVASEDATGTGIPSPGQVHTSYNGANGILQEWRTSLAAYNGQTIYVAFLHDSGDDNMILLDDILIGILPTNDLALTDMGGNSYPMIPSTQVAPINYRGTIRNNFGPGANPSFHVNVKNAGLTVFADSTNMLGTLFEGQDTVLTILNGHTPIPLQGTYQVTGWASSDSVDVNPANDTLRYTYMVTDSVYAREQGANTASLSINNRLEGILGQLFTIVNADELTSVSFYRDGGRSSGDSMRVVIYRMGLTSPDSLIAVGDWIMDSSGAAGWRLYYFGNDFVTLDPGEYLIGLEEAFTTRLEIGTNANYYEPRAAWVFVNNLWSNPEDFGFTVALQIRPNFGLPRIVGVEAVAPPKTLAVFPQPARDWLTLDLETPPNSATIYNSSGAVVQQWHSPSSTTLPIQNLSPGIYVLEVEQEEERLYQRFVKQ